MTSAQSISPAVLFIIVILAVIFFISGLLHLLIRFLVKKTSSHSSPRNLQEFGGPDALQRQLQQLFHLHDSGLDQASIDSLPVFLYREIVAVGSNDPFDCAVCLCEFSSEDQLRLLPACGHAFHLDCIDTWLLSNSTCPLCRGALVVENPTFDLDDDSRLDDVVSVRLGKFQSTGDENNESEDNTITKREAGESSSSNLDARRCYSMGSYQYVLGDTNLRVALSRRGKDQETSRNSVVAEEEGRRLGDMKGESFSMSKIWLWKNASTSASASAATPIGAGLPWMSARRSVGDVV